MNFARISILLSFVLCACQPALAQDRWSFELRGGVAVPTDDLGATGLNAGPGFEGTVAYRVMPHLAVYGGWDWLHFSTDEPASAADVDVEETGYAFGVKFVHPVGESPLRYLVRVGGILDHLELENEDGDTIGDTDHGLGWEAGLALVVPLGKEWDITPGVRYRSLSRDLESGATTTSVDLNSMVIGAGFTRPF